MPDNIRICGEFTAPAQRTISRIARASWARPRFRPAFRVGRGGPAVFDALGGLPAIVGRDVLLGAVVEPDVQPGDQARRGRPIGRIACRDRDPILAAGEERGYVELDRPVEAVGQATPRPPVVPIPLHGLLEDEVT